MKIPSFFPSIPKVDSSVPRYAAEAKEINVPVTEAVQLWARMWKMGG